MTVFPSVDLEGVVREVYAEAAREPLGLCCPSTNDPKLLAAVPAEVLEHDYGCGDPTRHVRSGERVLDLGSGAGKAGYLLAQVVGPEGRVIGVDMNDAMLALSRRHLQGFEKETGLGNLEFRKARIQDLLLDLEALDRYLAVRPVTSSADMARVEAYSARLRAEAPLVADQSVDVVVSDCVLNLVRPEDKPLLFQEIHRVLKRGGRAVISDIVSDEDVPARLRNDPELWAGCISGALRENHFVEAFEEAGFYGMTLVERAEKPWRTVEGIEFRSVTLVAYKGKEGACWDHKQAVIYQGPFREVTDDDGHVLRRGVPVAVCDKTFNLYRREPYAGHFAFVEPREAVSHQEARPFACGPEMLVRDPRESKGDDYHDTTDPDDACDVGCSC